MGAALGDISRKFTEYLEGRKDGPVHFLGAMVLDQKQTPTTHVEKRQIIDGQQRLTTLQIFLAAFRDFCREQKCDDLAEECDVFTINRGMMAEPDVEKYKHFLASHRGIDIPIKHLFVEYKYWIDKDAPFSTVKDELATLSRQGDDFRRIIEPKRGDPIYALVRFLDVFDIRTAYPLLLALLHAQIDESKWMAISRILESYLLRRAVCGLSTKNYNRIFLTMTRNLRRDGITAENLATQLLGQRGESVEWPTDDAFREAWRSRHAYHTFNNQKIVHILKRLNDSYIGNKTESVSVDGQLTVEHLLPQQWIEHWPLADGTKGLTETELWNAEPNDQRAASTRARNSMLQTLGNLTILTQALNSAASNSSWSKKKPELIRHSLLPINQQLHDVAVLDETAIEERSDELFQRALRVWPRS